MARILDPNLQVTAIRNSDPNIRMADNEAEGVKYPTYISVRRKNKVRDGSKLIENGHGFKADSGGRSTVNVLSQDLCLISKHSILKKQSYWKDMNTDVWRGQDGLLMAGAN